MGILSRITNRELRFHEIRPYPSLPMLRDQGYTERRGRRWFASRLTDGERRP